MGEDKKICLVDGCGNKILSKGLCGKHYQRQWKFGDVDYTMPPKERAKCSECEKLSHAFGFCKTHYQFYKTNIFKLKKVMARCELLEQEKRMMKHLQKNSRLGEDVLKWQKKLFESEEDAREVMKELAKLARRNKFLEDKVLELKDEIEYLRLPDNEFEESTLGERLKRMRELKGFTIQDTLKKLNHMLVMHSRGQITEGHFEEWEGDVGKPDYIHIIFLGRIWDCSTRYLERGLIENVKNRLYRSNETGADEEDIEDEWADEQEQGEQDRTRVC